MEHKPFWVLADYLANFGIGSLRMDDRGIGGSDKGKSNPTTADFATDIASAVTFLVQKGYENIGLLGHSEGGMIAPMVATEDKHVNFLILLASPSIPCSDLLILQNEALGKAQGLSKEKLQENLKLNMQLYSLIKNYNGNALESDVTNLLRQQLRELYQKTLSSEEIESLTKSQSKALNSAWFRYFIKFEPSNYLEQLQIPILALNGTLDLQVTAKENVQGFEKIMQKSGNKNYTVNEFEGLNHLFQHAKSGLPTEYGKITETISPNVMETIANWIKKLE